MFERYTEQARRVLFFARYEASQLGSTAIHSEHLLLGLLRERKGISEQIFEMAGLDSLAVHFGEFVRRLLPPANSQTPQRLTLELVPRAPAGSPGERMVAVLTDLHTRPACMS